MKTPIELLMIDLGVGRVYMAQFAPDEDAVPITEEQYKNWKSQGIKTTEL